MSLDSPDQANEVQSNVPKCLDDLVPVLLPGGDRLDRGKSATKLQLQCRILRARLIKMAAENQWHPLARLAVNFAAADLTELGEMDLSLKIVRQHMEDENLLEASARLARVEGWCEGQKAPRPTGMCGESAYAWDAHTKQHVWIDLHGTKKWGSAKVPSGWDPYEDGPEIIAYEELYEFPGGRWILLSEVVHGDEPTGLDVERWTEQQAADWLATHGVEMPQYLRQLAKHKFFDFDAPAPRDGALVPHWDKNSGGLTLAGSLARSVDLKAKNVIKVLDDFEQDGWPSRIDSPFSPDENGKTQLREAMRTINKGLVGLRFAADGTGMGIVWNVLPKDPSGEDDLPF